MKILLCPDKMKGSLSAQLFCTALVRGMKHTNSALHIKSHPMADGGDGSIDILKSYRSLRSINIETVDPLGRPIHAPYYHDIDTAYIELASASGIVLLDHDERNPLVTSTLGTGIMIKDAIDRGYTNIYLFIGGSATNDGGIGIAQALGYSFLDDSRHTLSPAGQSLQYIDRIVHDNLIDLHKVAITVLCDVTNPMYGSRGAAHVYGAQKGAKPEDISILDDGLRHYADLLHRQYQVDLSDVEGTGAAGAVSASLIALCRAQLQRGFDTMSMITGLEDAIRDADMVITGEGKIDSTSYQGKVVGNVLRLCQKYQKPIGIVGGAIESLTTTEQSFEFHHAIVDRATSIEEAIACPERFLFEIGKDIGVILLKDGY